MALAELKSRSWPEPMRERARALDLPASLDQVLMKVLSPRAADRYGSARFPARARAGPARAASAPRDLARGGLRDDRRDDFLWPRGGRRDANHALRLLSRSFMSDDPAAPVPVIAAVPGAPTTTATMKPMPTTTPTAIVKAIPTAVPGSRSGRARSTDKRAPADPILAALAAGAALIDQNSLADALSIHRALAAQHPGDVRAVRAWAETAAAARDWTEAARGAEAWALIDASVEPRLYLARMLGHSGRNGQPCASSRISSRLTLSATKPALC